MWLWIKSKLGILELERQNKELREQLKSHERFVERKVAEIKEFTTIDADIDIGPRAQNTIIMSGVYKGKAWVKFYDMGGGHFENFKAQLEYLNKYGYIRNIDAPPQIRGWWDIG